MKTLPALLLAVWASATGPHAQTTTGKPRVLVFFGCGGAVHASIPYINAVWQKLAAVEGLEIDTTRLPTVFTGTNLARYAAVLWNNATHPGKVLDSSQRAAWLAYGRTGGYVGMHAAGDASDTWPDYSSYMGGTNSQHSNTLPATLYIEPGGEAARHPILLHAGWPASLTLADEWYSWRINPRLKPGIKVLYSLDEKTFTPGVAMGEDHPIMWVRESAEGGRMVYMGMGHNIDLFKPELAKGYAEMEKLMRASLLWAIKRIPVEGVALVPQAPGSRKPSGERAWTRQQGFDLSGRALPWDAPSAAYPSETRIP